MCDPVIIAAVGAQAAQIAQQQQQADIHNKLEKVLYGQRKEAAFDTFVALQERELQERESASQSIRQITQQARQAAGAAQLQALEAGVGGRSLSLLLQDFERSQATGVGIAQTNLSNISRQLHEQAVAAGRIQGPNKVFGPLDTPLGIVASASQIGAAGANAASGGAP